MFCKGTKWCFDNISIKGHSLENDFLYVDLCNIDTDSSDQWVDRIEDSLKNGTSYSINNQLARDGLFEEEGIFLVFEKKDIEFLINLFKISIRKIGSSDDPKE